MKALVTLASLVSLTSVAAAESYDATQPAPKANTYVALDTTIIVQRSISGGFGLSGGMRLSDTPLFARVAVAGGVAGSEGRWQQARVGAEARGCIAREWVCAFGGVDAGYQHDHVIDDLLFTDQMHETNAHDLLFVPRAGFELGKQLKLRSSLELPYSIRLDEREQVVGIALTAGLAGSF